MIGPVEVMRRGRNRKWLEAALHHFLCFLFLIWDFLLLLLNLKKLVIL
jgi:hypothetical protein